MLVCIFLVESNHEWIVDSSTTHHLTNVLEAFVDFCRVPSGEYCQLANINLSLCKYCVTEENTRKPFGKATTADYPLQLIHSSIYGPMNVRARHVTLYFITFINDHS